MKTIGEVADWCHGAAVECGDPAIPVGQLFAQYATLSRMATLDNLDDAPVLCAFSPSLKTLLLRFNRQGAIGLPLCIPPHAPVIGPGGLEAFGLEKIVPGVWALNPSLNIPGVIHVFVVLYAVPTPAPWE